MIRRKLLFLKWWRLSRFELMMRFSSGSASFASGALYVVQRPYKR